MRTALIVICFLALFVWAILYCERDTRKLYAGLDAIWNKARNTHNRANMLAIRQELIDYHKKHCWHRAHGDYARRILAYIDGWLGHVPEEGDEHACP